MPRRSRLSGTVDERPLPAPASDAAGRDADKDRSGWTCGSGLSSQRIKRGAGRRWRAPIPTPLGRGHGITTRVEITIYRVTVTEFGASLGWTVATLCDEVLEVGAPTMATGPELH
jgi:hypothetical protein